jgi:hypothetical protein
MTDLKVIEATYTEWKMIKTRKVLQLILEIPLERQGDVLIRLGPPMPDREKWVAVALLDELVARGQDPKAQLKGMLERSLEHEARPKDLDRSLAGKQHYANSSVMEQARDRSIFLANHPKFIAWANGVCKSYNIIDHTDAAIFIRERCGVDSRAEIAIDPDAYREFIKMETEYKIDTGQFAESRG